MMHKFNSIILSFILILCLSTSTVIAQVSVNTDGATPHESSMLDLQSNNQGFLMPRMTQANRLAINSPAQGLLLFQTDDNAGFYYNEGTAAAPNWVDMPVDLTTTEFLCDSRIPIDSVWNGTYYNITQPGSYYFTDSVSLSGGYIDGVRIDAHNVTLDLNGYTLRGGASTDDGIVVLGDQDNIVIKNGIVEDWGGDGINALNADYSIFENLIVRNNDGDGLVTDFNCLITKCQAKGNGLDGLEGDDGTIISDCSASENGDNGIQSSEGCIVINCTSYKNESDGFDCGAGSRIEGCNASENGIYGIDIALGGQVINCQANRNQRNGIDVASSGLIMNNIANDNGQCFIDDSCVSSSENGAGIRTFANSQIINNICNGNKMGIRISSTDCCVQGNYTANNGHSGITATSSGSFLIQNHARNNGFSPIQYYVDQGVYTGGNFEFNTSCTFGPIIDLSAGVGDISTTTNADHPQANFEY